MSLLTVLDGVQSCDHNYLLMGAKCDESCELMYEYTKHVVQETEKIESKQYEVQSKTVTFECRLIPSDQKWMAVMAGELNNVAMNFSSFANVSKKNITNIHGAVGEDPLHNSNNAWQHWCLDALNAAIQRSRASDEETEL